MTPEIKYLEQRYREAWLTARRLSSGIQLGHGSGWPEMIFDQREQIRRAEREVLTIKPTPDQEDRLMECIRWLTPLLVDERKLVWMRAALLPWRTIAQQAGLPRSTAQRYWHKALLAISLHHQFHKEVDGS